MSVRKLLETLANVAVLTVSCLLIWVLISHRALFFHGAQRETQATPTAPAPVSLVGTTLLPVSGVKWADHNKTLVLAIRIGCHYCEASMPFYESLSQLAAAHKLHVHLLAVMPDSREQATTLLRSKSIVMDASYDNRLTDLGIEGTPTLLLVDAQGKVYREWEGQLASRQQQDVIAAIE
jgi:thiol-disulfide isomerase/thioredoxin